MPKKVHVDTIGNGTCLVLRYYTEDGKEPWQHQWLFYCSAMVENGEVVNSHRYIYIADRDSIPERIALLIANGGRIIRKSKGADAAETYVRNMSLAVIEGQIKSFLRDNPVGK